MSLFSRNSDLPGEHGVLRDCTPGGKGMKKFSAGDFAVINAANISRQEAQTLVDLKPAAVINVAEFSTGSIPNYGPHMLLDADVTLLEGVGEDFVSNFKDGKKSRITEEGEVFVGDSLVANATPVTREKAEENFSAAQRELIDHMEAYFGNSIEFIHSEGPLLIDGLGVPDSGSEMAGRKVLVVSPAEDHRAKIKLLRNFIREYEPVIIGVDAAADSLVEMGYKPDFIVGNPSDISSETLRGGARVILPADPDGTAEGLERIQDLGIGAMTFPAATDSATDLALLLADYHGAQIIVQVGGAVDLDDIFANKEHATPAAMLTRLKAGTRLVDADSVIDLYTAPAGAGLGWLWALLGVLVALAVVVLIVGLGGSESFGQNLIDTWNNFALSVQGWFK
ncbi:putative cytokinetic ring protein SteA [Corynebacterium sp.]|uniref:putative cytokinetic ring protein SteA n=1 Tax=Corynebacterium sp. TaxID=1720 RepID=UPI0026DB2744|nr:putative cytokinetic ring protein SteA [Corynebacterium sp.]MDO5031642.1 putative cytokinetic ring protein SteA [Corynebacterium sp.]